MTKFDTYGKPGNEVDVLVAGGGPAGLSAALVLGRCRRQVLLCDTGQARNAVASTVHGYLGVANASAADLRAAGRAQLGEHPNVRVREIAVREVIRVGERFAAFLADGSEIACRKIIVATGVTDELPDVPGIRELWGRVVFPCPYCDGWEFRGRRLAALALGCEGAALTRALTTWSNDVTLLTNHPLDAPMEAAFARRRVPVVRTGLVGLEPHGDGVRLQLADGSTLERDAIFVAGPQKQKSGLLVRLGCALTDSGLVDCRKHQATSVPGVFVVGDAAANIQFAIIAAAEGATAAFAVNRELLHEDFGVE